MTALPRRRLRDLGTGIPARWSIAPAWLNVEAQLTQGSPDPVPVVVIVATDALADDHAKLGSIPMGIEDARALALALFTAAQELEDATR